jgi:hypothetical protein
MANVLTTEVIRPRERALVYADARRTTTKVVEFDEGTPRLSGGNLLYNWIGEGVQRVVFHGAIDDADAIVRVEELIAASPDDVDRFGIDLDFSTLGNVAVDTVAATDGRLRRGLALGDMADGFIYLEPRADWRPVVLAEPFLDDANLAAAERQYRAIDPRRQPYTIEELETVRVDGHDAIVESWPTLPETNEPAKDNDGGRKRFARRR